MKNRLKFPKLLPKNRRVFWRLKFVGVLKMFHGVSLYIWKDKVKI
jgi:hypothetical protein